MDNTELTPEASEAIHKARNAAQAIEIARQAQLAELLDSDKFSSVIERAVQRSFSAGKNEGRYLDVSRVPLICQSIVGIDKKLEELVTQQEFWPVKTLVYGIVGLMLSGTIGALLMLVLRR